MKKHEITSLLKWNKWTKNSLKKMCWTNIRKALNNNTVNYKEHTLLKSSWATKSPNRYRLSITTGEFSMSITFKTFIFHEKIDLKSFTNILEKINNLKDHIRYQFYPPNICQNFMTKPPCTVLCINSISNYVASIQGNDHQLAKVG